MAELTPEQKGKLQFYGNPEVVETRPNGDIVIAIGGSRYVITYKGYLFAEKEKVPKKARFQKPEKPGKPKWDKEEKVYVPYTLETVCVRRPELCKPREVHHVAWDADDTMWRIEPGTIASSITGRLEKIDEDTVIEHREPPPKVTPSRPPAPKEPIDLWGYGYGTSPLHREEEVIEEWWKTQIGGKQTEETTEIKEIATELIRSLPEKNKKMLKVTKEITGKQVELIQLPPPKEPQKLEVAKYEPKKTTIKLAPTFRETLAKLEAQGITNSVISLNSPGSVKRILEAFGIADRFIEIADTWKNKADVFEDIMKKHHICGCNAIFVDNMLGHVEDVSRKCGMGLQIGKGKDIEQPIQILDFIKECK